MTDANAGHADGKVRSESTDPDMTVWDLSFIHTSTSPKLIVTHAIYQPPPDESPEFINLSKTRFRRRLKDRWSCRFPGHTHCFTRIDGTHVPLSDEAIELWVSALVLPFHLI
jgi:hypothetical protein